MGISSPLVDLRHQYDLLQKEYEYEKETYRQQSERMGLRKRVAQGLCWYPVVAGRSYYNSLNQLVIEIERTEDREIEHSFEYGRPVCFFTTDISGKFKYLDFSATISYVQEDRMVVILPSLPTLATLQGQNKDLGVQLYFDETSYKAMFSALSDVMRAKNNRLSHLRDVLLGQEKPRQRELFPIRFPWLNHSQEEAVNKVLGAKQVSIVHGPPGTGKTTTLVEAIYETLHRENQVIVCAQSNTAVDCISEKLVDRGINVLRIGNPTRINDKMLSFTYERRFEAHPDYTELWSIRKAIRDIQSNMRKKSRGERDTIRNRLSRLKFRATELEVKIDMELFNEARVVACTLVGSANRVMMNRHFTTLFIDEAAQALEAACWIAIGKADRVILAGDHHQLPPTIKCIEAEREGLGHTLLQKIASTKPETVSLLRVQYRMHEDIMRFSSRWFYHNQLESAPEVSHRGILRLDIPIVWFDTSGCDFTEDTKEESMSRVNRQEAELLVEQLRSYIEKISMERVLDESIDFGLISPYKAQVQYIRKLIRQDAFFKRLRQLITVHTVDGFQGQERDVILISLVRANENGQIGFLSDLRRMNVAITRARMKLMILGDASTLTRHVFYKELYDYISQIGKIITIHAKREHER
ncbi:AAA domain-containing protein [uncultured Parabacteroides sp.]|uniref:AAA domain-containing protein n=1 Tax=uncultured Parabacteroides sp. TaxID=512312 RepID=UPI00260A230B|nr:AAA domain-containing protein [uncultured Parabacteroides sp.]